MTGLVVLDTELIERLMGALSTRGAPMVQHLNPGLSEREMAALVAPLGMVLPQEAEAWWGYADGVSLDTPRSANITPSWSWRPLAETVEMCREMRRTGSEGIDPGEPNAFADSWLPVVRGDGMLVIDTSQTALAPVYAINWHTFDPEDPPAPALPSLGALVASWTVALERRALWFDEAQQLFTGDGELLDELGVDWELV